MRRMSVCVFSLAGLTAALVVAYALAAQAPRDGQDPKPKPEAKQGEAERPGAKQGPGNEFGAPGSPRDGDRRRPGRGRADFGSGNPEDRRPGLPDGPDGPDGPRRFGPGGPGKPGGPRFDGPLEQDDPEIAKLMESERDLDRQTRDLAQRYRRAEKDQRDSIKAELQKAVTAQFEARQKRRQLELTRLEEELKRLREAMDRREKNRKDLIEKRVTELLGEEEGF